MQRRARRATKSASRGGCFTTRTSTTSTRSTRASHEEEDADGAMEERGGLRLGCYGRRLVVVHAGKFVEGI